MRLPSHLRLSRHGVWCFRLVLPDVLAVALGQKEIRRSLGTRCPITAKLLAYRLSGRILPIIRETKRAMEFDPNSIDPSKVRELTIEGLVIDKRARTVKADRIETNPDPVIAGLELAAVSSMADPDEEVSPEVLAYRANLRAQLEANIPIPKPKPGKPCTLGEGIGAFLKHKGNLAKGSITTYTYRLNLLASLVGGPDKMLHDISEEDCVDAAEKFQDMSPHASKRSQVKDGGGTVSAGTVKDTLSIWQSFFTWAIRSKRYVGVNPIKEISRPSVSNAQGGAEAFEPDELQKIFQPNIFAAMKRPHQYWGPLLALFTGARSNELAQLRLSDFTTVGGIRCIRIKHDPEAGTQLKNEDSNRKLPLHPTLWAIGLQDYLDDLKEIGADRLFPNLPEDKHGKREKYLSRDFNEVLLGKLEMRKARVKVLHSFRDTLASMLAEASVHDSHISDWMGHARQGVGPKHYFKKTNPAILAKTALPVLEFGVDFSEFRYERGRWNDWLRKNLVP